MKDDLYASHLPILARIVELSYGPILELGMGFSTLLLHVMCKQSKRMIVSYENDLKWYKANRKYESDFHYIKFITDWDTMPTDYIDWGVVLIDHRPARRRRVEAMRLRDKADYILLHDSEPEIDRFYGYSSIYKHFKYRYDYKKAKPYTTVLSNYRDLSIL